MSQMDALQLAAGAYTEKTWDASNWRQFGRETGMTDILTRHPRLYRSQDWGDDDYPDAALEVLGQVLAEAGKESPGEKGRMDLLADAMPDLPAWIAANAPARTQRLFRQYLAARDVSEIPEQWRQVSSGSGTAPGTDPISDLVAPEPAPWERAAPSPPNQDPEPFEWEPAAPPSRGPAERASGDVAQPTTTSPTTAGVPAAISEPRGSSTDAGRSLFIVHGHDEAALNSVRVYVHRQAQIMPISLAEEAGRGQTIIEKFENYGADASYVIVLLTPDDVGQTIGKHQAGDEPSPRARQNVVLELGYFIGKLGRGNVVVLDASVERPSDLNGLSYISYPGLNWKDELRTELVAAGIIN
ncbi:TIR domain-containing protein [Rathayibacter sp. Leaf296]|uniref:TIR domain-containing protein n=1 Tax=Rathayibacter sp. Leaf296 TaxID=1736327 RepID=UPI0009E80EF8|nr:TIR domain-containing protein [Rathayibacter sp. Leaf296]